MLDGKLAMKFRTLATGLGLTLACLSAAQAQTLEFASDLVPLRAELVATGLENPWGMAFLPDGDAVVTERTGNIRILSDGKLSDPLSGVPEVAAQGQGGLLDIAVAPDFGTSGTIYFTFSEPGEGGAGTAIATAKLVRDTAGGRLDEVKTIFSMNQKTSTNRHFGSRIVLRADGTIFVTTGDRGKGQRSQDMFDHAGAVLRINADGSVPQDNPYADGREAAAEIWSKGHRNIQGATLDPVSGQLVISEHGAKGGDEINYPEAGKNYGWPRITYGVDYSGAAIGDGQQAPGLEQPAFYWDPSVAPSGLVVYDGDMFPEWKGDLLSGSLKFGLLSRLNRDEQGKILGEERMLEGEFGRIRDVRQGPDGAIWLLTDETSGSVIRVSRGE